MRAEHPVFEESSALASGAVGFGAHGVANVVDEAERGTGHHLRVRQIEGHAVGEFLALPAAVRPRGVAAIAGAERDRGVQPGLHLEPDLLAGAVHELHPHARRDPGSGRVVDGHAHPVELLDPTVGPAAGAVVETAVPVRVLLQDEEKLEVVERQRQVQPPHAPEYRVRPAGRFGLAHRADAPRAVPGGDRRVVGDLHPLVVDLDPPLPRPDLCEAARLERHPTVGEHGVRVLQRGGEQAAPREVRGDALRALEGQPDLPQRLDHLQPVPADVGIEAVVVDGVAHPHRRLRVAAADHEVRVLHAQARVVADPGEHHEAALAVQHVEVGAVVEVAVRGGRPRQGRGRLVDGELVERAQVHGALPRVLGGGVSRSRAGGGNTMCGVSELG